MTKSELLLQIETDRRQLLRYLFYFEKDEQGDFVPSDRLKFSEEQMHVIGVDGDLSIKDLVVLLSGREKFFIEWYEYKKSQKPFNEFHKGLSLQELDHVDDFILEDKQDQSLTAALQDFKLSHQRLLELLNRITEDELAEKNRYKDMQDSSLIDYLPAVTWESYRRAEGILRKWSRSGTNRMDKEQLLEKIQTERRRLEKNLASLNDHEMVSPGVIGQWSVKDILSHLVDWEQRFLGWYRDGQQGKTPQTPAPGFTWSEIDRLNQQIYEQNEDRPLSCVMSDFKISYSQVIKIVKGLPEEEIFSTGHFT